MAVNLLTARPLTGRALARSIDLENDLQDRFRRSAVSTWDGYVLTVTVGCRAYQFIWSGRDWVRL